MTVRWKKKNNDEILTMDAPSVREGVSVPLLKFQILERMGLVTHCFTTRLGGVSKGVLSSMNLSFTRGDNPAAVKENFRRAAQALGVDDQKMILTDQTHTTNVRKVMMEDAGKGLVRERDYKDVDGLVTDVPGLVLSAFFADCVPLYFVDPVHRAIGLSHSGWRGTVGRMGKAVIELMEQEYGTKARDLVCAIGPSICQDCYEVSMDVADAFMQEFAGKEAFILKEGQEGKYQLNLWKANEIVLTDAGVLKEHLAVTNICTCCNPDLLFSHRASKGQRGNLAAFLSLNEHFK